MPRSGVGHAAAAAVCSAYDTPRLALCVVGEPAGSAADAVFRSIFANVLAALGANSTAFLALHAPPYSPPGAREATLAAADAWLRPASSTWTALASESSAATEDAGGACRRRVEAIAAGRRNCHEQLRAYEQRAGASLFTDVLVVPADELWVVPLWPYCLQPADAATRGVLTQRNRHHGSIWCA